MSVGNVRSRVRNRTLLSRAGKARILLCAVAIVLSASVGLGQPVPDTILLPDSLGPLRPGYHLAFGSSTNNIYVASESSDIIVVDGNTFQRIKRINTGTSVGGVLLVSQHNKLYCTYPSRGRIGIIDCTTNDTVGSIQVSTRPKLLCYSLGSDKLYVGDSVDGTLSVIDCTVDTVCKGIAVGDSISALVYDPTRDRMYAAAVNGISAIACTSDTVIARIDEVARSSDLCISRRQRKLYALGRGELYPETLYVISTLSDTLTAKIRAPEGMLPGLACNEATDRLYVMEEYGLYGIVEFDCAGDSMIRRRSVGDVTGLGLICDTVRNRLFCLTRDGDFCFLAEYDCATLDRLGITQVADYAWNAYALALDMTRRKVWCGGGGWRSSAGLSVFDCDSDTLPVIGAVPLSSWMLCDSRLCFNPTGGKLYYRWGGGSGSGVGVIDDQTNRAVKQVLIPTRGTYYSDLGMAYSVTSNKLYCCVPGAIAVLDGVGDSLLRMIDIDGLWYTWCTWIPGCDKLYCFAVVGSRKCVFVVDCTSDSVIRVIDIHESFDRGFEYLGSDRILGWSSQGRLTLFDYNRDSILVDTTIDPYLNAVTHSGDGEKIYLVKQYQWLQVLDASTLSLQKEINWFYPRANFNTLTVSDSAHKLYWCFEGDSILAVDTRADTVVARMQTLDSDITLSYPCLDPSQRYLFRPNGFEGSLLVYDMQSDSLAAIYPTMPYPVFAAANPELDRIYVGCPDAILVYPDTVVSGVCEGQATAELPHPPTLVRDVLSLPETQGRRSRPACLLDAGGRRVLELRPGANDVRALPTGIYFVCTGEQGRVRKIVIAR